MKPFVLMGIALLLNLAAAAAPGDFLSDLYRQTNAVRAEHGAPPVREGLRLGIAAQQHAEEMAALGYFSHVSPTASNRTLQDRLRNAGESAVRAAENLALYSQRDDLAAQVVQGWLESESHRAALLNGAFTHVGFGAATDEAGRVYVAQVFAWKPWEYISGGVNERGDAWIVELRYALPPQGVVAYVGASRVPAMVRGDRVALVVDDAGAELMLGHAAGSEVVFFDAFHLAPGSTVVRPGRPSQR